MKRRKTNYWALASSFLSRWYLIYWVLLGNRYSHRNWLLNAHLFISCRVAGSHDNKHTHRNVRVRALFHHAYQNYPPGYIQWIVVWPLLDVSTRHLSPLDSLRSQSCACERLRARKRERERTRERERERALNLNMQHTLASLYNTHLKF